MQGRERGQQMSWDWAVMGVSLAIVAVILFWG